MRVSSFDYELPAELIAQAPLPERTASRLLVVDRARKALADRHFYELADYLQAGDVLVLNDTKVLPVRLTGVKAGTGAKVEILLLKTGAAGAYEVLAKPARRLKAGDCVQFAAGFTFIVREKLPDGVFRGRLDYPGILAEALAKVGKMPLPPYIHAQKGQNARYQTVYAAHPGSAAAPTAGFHFTEALLDQLAARGVEIVKVTLAVGLGTFRPVSAETVEEHVMHSEQYTISAAAAETLNRAKAAGRRIIPVGTTSLRALEANFAKYGQFQATTEETAIFIYPGFQFQATSALITNFHLPKSTLLMLVAALAGLPLIKKAYAHAIAERYRFFSFGDAMLIM